MSDRNVKTIQTIYAAFGRGDVPTILEHVTEDTRWDFNGGTSDVPWHGPYQGRACIPEFLAAFTGGVALEAFEPRTFMHDGAHVIVHLRLAFTVKRTGKRVDEEQLHWWSLDERGLVTRLRHFEDTAQVVAAQR